MIPIYIVAIQYSKYLYSHAIPPSLIIMLATDFIDEVVQGKKRLIFEQNCMMNIILLSRVKHFYVFLCLLQY